MAMKINKNDFEEDVSIETNVNAKHKSPTPRPQKAFSLDRKPTSWTALWWPIAKQQIENAAPEHRLALIKTLQLATGQAISAFPDKNIQKSMMVEAETYFELLAKHLEIKEYYEQARAFVSKGVVCGPFTDEEPIPPFLAQAWEIVKNEIPVEEEEVVQLPEEAGTFAGIISGDGSLAKIPDAPTDVFPPEIQKVIQEVAETKSVPEGMVLGMVLALASACIGRSRGVQYRSDWKECANLYLMLIAETGAGKSHTFNFIFKYVKEYEKQQKAIWKEARKKYNEDLMAYRKSKDASMVPPKRPPNIQFLLDDATMEAVSERLEDNPRGLFWSVDEFSGFFTSLDKYNKSGNDGKRRLLSAWNVEAWSSSRKSKDGEIEERYIPEGCIGLFGGIQPHHVKDVFTYADVKQGLPQRFLYLRAKIEKAMLLPTPEISQEVDATVKRMTEKMLSLDMKVNKDGLTVTSYLTLSPEAKVVFEDFNNRMQTETFGTDSAGYSLKFAQITLRVALIMHFLEWTMSESGTNATNDLNDRSTKEYYCSPIISQGTMENAIHVMDWFSYQTQEARMFFPGAMDVKQSDKLDEKKHAIYKFANKNEDFCREWREASELIDAGLKWKKNAMSLGRYLSRHKFPKNDEKYTTYKIFPLPEGFIAKP